MIIDRKETNTDIMRFQSNDHIEIVADMIEEIIIEMIDMTIKERKEEKTNMKTTEMIGDMNKEIFIRINMLIEIEIMKETEAEILIKTDTDNEILIEILAIREIKTIGDINKTMMTSKDLIKDMIGILIKKIMNEIIKEDNNSSLIETTIKMTILYMKDIMTNMIITDLMKLTKALIIN